MFWFRVGFCPLRLGHIEVVGIQKCHLGSVKIIDFGAMGVSRTTLNIFENYFFPKIGQICLVSIQFESFFSRFSQIKWEKSANLVRLVISKQKIRVEFQGPASLSRRT